LNERQRLRDQKLALSYPFHHTPRPQTLQQEPLRQSKRREVCGS
jgi:hypothetical protein